jgi:hypothetical protein
MGIQINGTTDTISASDGSLTVSGIVTGANIENAIVTSLSTTNLNVTGVATYSNLTVTGVSTVTDTRIQNVSEKLARVDGNTVSIVYNTGSGNIGFCTNPTGDITLSVTGIPVDNNFDNQTLMFSVIVSQTGTARTCNAVTLNGVSKTIRWSGGTVGTASTTGYDIFSFVGINTIGSASTTTNYEVLGTVNGGFR